MFCYTFVRNGLAVQHTSKPATNQKNASVKIAPKVIKNSIRAQKQ